MRIRETWDLTEIRKRANGEKLIRAELALAAAKRMLPDADEAVIEDQAVALCYLPDDELIDTAARMKAADEAREPKTAFDRYFQQCMQDPEFAADYNEERAIIDVIDAVERLRRVRAGVDP
jgi:hypothetical protein